MLPQLVDCNVHKYIDAYSSPKKVTWKKNFKKYELKLVVWKFEVYSYPPPLPPQQYVKQIWDNKFYLVGRESR
jgi:hypothetical protein